MAESALNNARALVLRPLAERLFADLVLLIVADIRALPSDLRLSGDDSRLENVWEEFKYQLQREDSVFFEAYEFEFRRLCRQRVDALGWPLMLLLWCWTDGIAEWEEESSPNPDEVASDVAEELYKQICAAADEEELDIDPDDPRTAGK
jgi:hypothetical protein